MCPTRSGVPIRKTTSAGKDTTETCAQRRRDSHPGTAAGNAPRRDPEESLTCTGADTARSAPPMQSETKRGMTSTIPSRMTAVQLVGHGGLDKLRYRGDVPTPAAGAGEVLLKVAAAGVNNTDINTRIGWYSKPASGATGDAGGAGEIDGSAAGWSGVPLAFPRIQGADCWMARCASASTKSPLRGGNNMIYGTCLSGSRPGKLARVRLPPSRRCSWSHPADRNSPSTLMQVSRNFREPVRPSTRRPDLR